MAVITPDPDGGAQVTVSPAETTGLKALSAQHLPALARIASWYSRDVAPEVHDAADFLRSLAVSPPEGSTFTVTPSQAQALRGLLTSHIPELAQVLAVVESPAVRELLTFAKALL